MSTPTLYLDTSHAVPILGAPIGYNLSTTRVAIQVKSALYKKPMYSTPHNCLQQCTIGTPHLCLAARYNLKTLVPFNATNSLMSSTCDIIDKPSNENNSTRLSTIYRFKYGSEAYTDGSTWVSQAAFVGLPPESSSPTPSKSPMELSVPCFDACDAATKCFMATCFVGNKSCLHFPLAEAANDEAGPDLWVWQARKDFNAEDAVRKAKERDGAQLVVKNLTEIVAKVHLEKGAENPVLKSHSGDASQG